VRTDTYTLLDFAAAYAKRGWPVFPVNPDKTPRVPGGFHAATTDIKQIRTWWQNGDRRSGIAVATGSASRLVVLDVDPRNGGDETLLDIVGGVDKLPDTVTCKTGGGGSHYYFLIPAGCRIRSGRLAPGIELKADGGYVVLPPSKHHSGGTYTWEIGRGPSEIEIAEVPEWLKRLIDTRIAANIEGFKHRSASVQEVIPEGERNNRLTSIAGLLRRRGIKAEAIYQALLRINALQCQPPLPTQEVRAIANSIARYSPESLAERCYYKHDMFHYEVVKPLVTDRFIFSPELGWMEYKEGVWLAVTEEYVTNTIITLLLEEYSSCINSIYPKANGNGLKDVLKVYTKAHEEIQKHSKAAAVAKLLEGSKEFIVHASEFDTDGWRLNLANGVLDLRTFEIHEHSPAYRCTMKANMEYDPNVTGLDDSPFVQHIIDRLGSQEIVRYVQRSLGMALVGETLDEYVDFWYGGGGRGKTTTINVITHCFGSYASKISPSVFLQRDANQQPLALADVRSKRLVYTEEISQGEALAEAYIKTISGGGSIKCRYLYRNYFEYKPTFTTIIVTNHRPVIKGRDEGIWRRVRLVPWERDIDPSRREPQTAVVERLLADQRQILWWLIGGLAEWRERQFWVPDIVASVTHELRMSLDAVTAFVDECCERQDGERTKVSELYERYKLYAEQEEANVLGRKAFTNALRDMGFVIRKVGSNYMVHNLIRKEASNESDTGG